MPRSREERLFELQAALEEAGANLTLRLPGRPPLAVGPHPGAAEACFRDGAALEALLSRDQLGLAEAYLQSRIDLDGDLSEILKVTDLIGLEPSRRTKLRFSLALALRSRRRLQRESIAFHYDRPPEFFLPWLDRDWRSYSHGLYATADDSLEQAQARKLQHALDALGLRPGMRVFDMGGGWGCFLEYAGRQGIRVEAVTISREQHDFVRRRIQQLDLPCSIELVDFLDFRPRHVYDGAVFLGTFEHLLDYGYAARFLARHLRPGGRLYTDFCSQRESFVVGDFMRRYIWPGTATYVELPRLLKALVVEGFNVLELEDDTLSYACTVRDWARRLEAARKELAQRFGEPSVRAFLLFLWGSYHFLAHNRTQAYHLVAGSSPLPLGSEGRVTAFAASTALPPVRDHAPFRRSGRGAVPAPALVVANRGP